jgi:serine/threonine protein phosphatase PrpC
MHCPVCEADNRQGAHFCCMCGVKFPRETIADAPSADEPGEATPERLESETGMDAPEAASAETPPESGSAEAGPQEAVSTLAPEGPPLIELVPEAAAAESFAAESEDILEIAALEETGDPLKPESDSEVGDTPEAPAVEPAPADGAPAEPVPEPEEPTALPGDALIEAETEVAEEDIPSESDQRSAPSTGPLGMLIADRYELVEALDASENEILYRAEDLGGCLQCDFEENAPDDAFCGHCGAALEQRPSVHFLETLGPEGEPSAGHEVASRLTHEDRTFLLLVDEAEEPEAQDLPATLRLLVGHRTDVGQVRGLNEDSVLVMTLAPTYESQTRPSLGLFAVADGMGGHQGGELASRLALQVLSSKVVETIILPELAGQPLPQEVIVELLRQATEAANDSVFLARQKRENDMGTTLTSAFVRNGRLFLAHVGDCRAYRWNADGLKQLTTDHSLVASMIASGQAEPDEIYTHPHRSVIHRCIGDLPLVEVDSDVISLAPGDRIIVCSDGLWEMVRSEGIDDVMLQEPDPQAACELLVAHANLAGGDDNISVIVIQLHA